MISEKEKIEVTVHQPFVLNAVKDLFMVVKGEANVFCVQIDEEGNYVSPLNFMYSIKKGELIFSLLAEKMTDNTRLIIFSDQATLLPISKNNLLTIDHFFLKKMVESWVSKTVNTLFTENSPRIYKGFERFGGVSLQKGDFAFPHFGLAWCFVQEGEIEAFSGGRLFQADQKPKFPILVFNKLWVQAKTKAKLTATSTSKIMEDEIDFMLAVNKLQEYFYEKLVENINQEKEREAVQLSQKVKNESED